MTDYINERKDRLTNVNCTVQFDISGDGGGPYYLTIADGQAAVTPGTVEKPTMTIAVGLDDFRELAATRLKDANKALMTGRVKLRGNLAMAFKLQSLLKE